MEAAAVLKVEGEKVTGRGLSEVVLHISLVIRAIGEDADALSLSFSL